MQDPAGDEFRDLGSRAKTQPPPAHIVFDSLRDPHELSTRHWLTLLPDEVEPRILEQVRPRLVVWSSLWPARPRDIVRYELSPDGGGGCLLRWTLLSPEAASPSEAQLGHLCRRLNVLINEKLALSYGS